MNATVLVIDDEPEIVRLLQECLMMDGHTVITGSDGQMALHLAISRHPDLIVLDVLMPMTNGLKALEFLRKTPETKDIPVIVLSGARSERIYPAIAQMPRVVFLKKPIDVEEMSSQVRQLLQQYSRAA
jgi:DNA-binding response OmpR family regulator